MLGLTFLGDIIIGVACVGVGVFYEAKIKGWYMGAEAYAASLRARADAIAPKISAAVDAIKKV
jgi:hypothetical protein